MGWSSKKSESPVEVGSWFIPIIYQRVLAPSQVVVDAGGLNHQQYQPGKGDTSTHGHGACDKVNPSGRDYPRRDGWISRGSQAPWSPENPSWKLTWQWNIHHLKMHFLLKKWGIFQRHLSELRGVIWISGTSKELMYMYIYVLYNYRIHIQLLSLVFRSQCYAHGMFILSGQFIATENTTKNPKWLFRKGNPLISGKSRMVKHYNLARYYIYIVNLNHLELVSFWSRGDVLFLARWPAGAQRSAVCSEPHECNFQMD